MTAISSKLTTKCQATIPALVREALGVGPGDRIAFEIDEGEGGVTLRKARPLDLAYAEALEGTLADEWLSPEDEEAYRDL